MEALLAHCASAFAAEGNIFLTFLVGGLTGGLTHCLVMCGPYVACERACASTHCGLKRAIPASLGLPYHLGRFITYGALGFGAALFARQLATHSWWPIVSALMLGAAGTLFLLSCLNSCLHHRRPSHASSSLTLVRGLLLGFMPCGLLYAALMMAATLANPLLGMLAMWLFTLGTMPALILASTSADLLSRKWRQPVQWLGRGMMAFNGIALIGMATHLVS